MSSFKGTAPKDYRALMLNRKTKIEAPKTTSEKITSPLAKYDNLGNLHCIICKVIVKSANVWKVHINTAKHKLNIQTAKQLKEDILKAKPISKLQSSQQTKTKINDSTTDKSIKKEETPEQQVAKSNKTTATKEESAAEVLPDNFFDNDAKESEKEKEALDEEWQRFQKEIKEESTISSVIVASEQDDVAYDRQLEEIDEQIMHWSKVKTLEEKKEQHILKKKLKTQNKIKNTDSHSDTDDSTDDTIVEEFPNWRSKKYKK